MWPAKVANQVCYARCKDCVLVWSECGAGAGQNLIHGRHGPICSRRATPGSWGLVAISM
ncbi:putative iron/sulfur-binding protein [Pseudomonas mandelii JR-1]|uniref:Putative iron/sulfur-binding protein n=1 Tax=Pseudomonas mandelii JR-1 TaxID=1147786 RepID=A0A024EFB0_9PSED|nr:putative iron/sulfur-binding protein [Pseudomonas mandelii JR-1]